MLKNLNSKFDYSQIYKYSSIVFAFTMPLSRASISFFLFFFPLIWLLEGNLKEKLKIIYSNNILKSIILFFIFMVISFFWSDNTSEALKTLRLYSYWILIFIFVTSIKEQYRQIIITAFLYGMLVSEIIAYGVYFELWSFKHATVENPSPFMFWIDYSVFLALSSIILFNRLFSNKYNTYEKFFIFLFFISVLGNLFLGIGRTGQVAFFFSVFIMFFLYFKVNIKSIFYGIITISLIFLLAYNLSDSFKKRVNAAQNDISLISNGTLDSSWGIRVAYIIIGKDILKDNFLFGVGAGDFSDEINKKLETIDYGLSKETITFMTDMHPHNQYLMVFLQSGLIGLVLMLNIFYQFIKYNLKQNDIEFRNQAFLFVSVFAVAFLAEPLWSKQFTIVLFILFLSVFSIQSEKSIEK